MWNQKCSIFTASMGVAASAIAALVCISTEGLNNKEIIKKITQRCFNSTPQKFIK